MAASAGLSASTLPPVYRPAYTQTKRRQPAPALRAQQPNAADNSAPELDAAAAVPSVGWLWNKKAADTQARLKSLNLRPKK